MTIRYEKHSPFHDELKARVNRYFTESQISSHGTPGFYAKALILFAWLVASYLLLTFAATNAWQAVALSMSLGLAAAGVGFNVSHDGNHGASSRRRRINHFMKYGLDVIGGSSYVWHWKHNVYHHNFTNISGADDDIDNYPLFRVTEDQKPLWIHRFQFLYVWVLYGFLAVYWQFFSDFKNTVRGRIGDMPVPRPKGKDLALMLGGKAFFVFWALVLPAFFHPFWKVLACYMVGSLTLGVTVSVVFQLAHCVRETQFPKPPADTGKLAHDWAAHQLMTTVDFARKNRLLSWYVGGLNFQIEHHLFPNICHVHYPAIAPIVAATCADYGVPYVSHGSLWAALASHFHWLKAMGQGQDHWYGRCTKYEKEQSHGGFNQLQTGDR